MYCSREIFVKNGSSRKFLHLWLLIWFELHSLIRSLSGCLPLLHFETIRADILRSKAACRSNKAKREGGHYNSLVLPYSGVQECLTRQYWKYQIIRKTTSKKIHGKTWRLFHTLSILQPSKWNDEYIRFSKRLVTVQLKVDIKTMFLNLTTLD